MARFAYPSEHEIMAHGVTEPPDTEVDLPTDDEGEAVRERIDHRSTEIAR